MQKILTLVIKLEALRKGRKKYKLELKDKISTFREYGELNFIQKKIYKV